MATHKPNRKLAPEVLEVNEYELTFRENKKPKKSSNEVIYPIAYIGKKIAFLNNKSKIVDKVEIESTWKCKITADKGTHYIINPIGELFSSKENNKYWDQYYN